MRILVADDNPAVREFLATVLEEAGFEVSQASDGAETLKRFRESPADLVLCDVFMPAKDGLEIIKVLRGEHPAIKIIAISGDSSALDMLRVAQFLGATEVLSKPIDVAKLLSTVRRVLRIN
ncbi:MAG TPA: response regulator [Blastocatellia bacterium]|nr:response regulator [Blastocatellia bacterium]